MNFSTNHSFLIPIVLLASIFTLSCKPDEDNYVLVEEGFADLGLSVQWAACNLGASTPEEFGDYYAWGELLPKSEYRETNYKWESNYKPTKYNSADGKTTLDEEDDIAAATVEGARIPTAAEIQELLDKCSLEFTNRNGIEGYILKSKITHKAIFLPAAGVIDGDELIYGGELGAYWSSSIHAMVNSDAWSLSTGHQENTLKLVSINRYAGLTIRPVLGKCSLDDLDPDDDPRYNNSDEPEFLIVFVTALNNDYVFVKSSTGESDLVESTGEEGTFHLIDLKYVQYETQHSIKKENVRWSSSKPEVAYVQGGQLVNAAPGRTRITANANKLEITFNHVVSPKGSVYMGGNLCWAKCNLGASSEEHFGDFFAYGETSPKEEYTYDNYLYKGSSVTDFYDPPGILKPNFDAATCILGKPWRTPTAKECNELVEVCSDEYGPGGYGGVFHNYHDVGCVLLRSGVTGGAIYFPECNSEWEGFSAREDLKPHSYITSSYQDTGFSFISLRSSSLSPRYAGFQIRPVLSLTDTELTRKYVTNITLSKTSLSLIVGEEETISVTSVLPEDADNKTYTWYSSDKTVATVNQDGKITAKAKGSVVIMALANDGSRVYASCSVVVKKAVELMPDGAVDLDLSVYWATCNLSESGFVSSPEAYGDYYAWGETETKSDYSFNTYKFSLSALPSGPYSKYNTNSAFGTVDNKTVLDPEDDVAHVKLGGSWRMPTDEEWTELRTECTWTWTTENGVSGRKVTGPNGNSIFLPAAGYRHNTSLFNSGSRGEYWSSEGGNDSAWSVIFNSDAGDRYGGGRCIGLSVRPVSE